MRVLTALPLWLLATFASAQVIYDGNRWIGEPAATRTGFVIGFHSGYAHGLVQALLDESETIDAGLMRRYRRYADATDNEWHGITAGQVADTMSDFYREPANRRILWGDALYWSLRKINGWSRSQLEALELNLRKSVARP